MMHASVDTQNILAFLGLLLCAFGAWQLGQFLNAPEWTVGAAINLMLPFIVGALAIRVSK